MLREVARCASALALRAFALAECSAGPKTFSEQENVNFVCGKFGMHIVPADVSRRADASRFPVRNRQASAQKQNLDKNENCFSVGRDISIFILSFIYFNLNLEPMESVCGHCMRMHLMNMLDLVGNDSYATNSRKLCRYTMHVALR